MVAVSPGTTKDTVVVAGTAQKQRNGNTAGKQLVVDPHGHCEGMLESRQDDTSTKNDTDNKYSIVHSRETFICWVQGIGSLAPL